MTISAALVYKNSVRKIRFDCLTTRPISSFKARTFLGLLTYTNDLRVPQWKKSKGLKSHDLVDHWWSPLREMRQSFQIKSFHVFMYIWGFRARQHLRSLALVTKWWGILMMATVGMFMIIKTIQNNPTNKNLRSDWKQARFLNDPIHQHITL